MSTHLTDAEIRDLVAHSTGKRREEHLKELRWRCRWAILRLLPARRGFCSAGWRILMDEKGAYSSGYPLHTTADDSRVLSGYCDHKGDLTFDEPSEHVKRLHALLDALH